LVLRSACSGQPFRFTLPAGGKEAAFELGTTERTIKAHRARIMEKMGVDSLASLVRAAEKLKSCGAFEFKK
jgi:Bacterial regulatory proteins, luxR family